MGGEAGDKNRNLGRLAGGGKKKSNFNTSTSLPNITVFVSLDQWVFGRVPEEQGGSLRKGRRQGSGKGEHL